MSEGQWYYCLKHQAVETFDGCRSEDRLGPYASKLEAEHAIERVHDRNEAWDNDPRWNDEEERQERRAGEDDGNPFTL